MQKVVDSRRHQNSGRSDARKPTTSFTRKVVDELVLARVRQLFALPGDYVNDFVRRVEQDGRLPIRTLSHEPSLVFAAQGEALARRTPAVVCVTYGAGALNAVNAIAAAYAEKVPLLVISGAPSLAERATSILYHHQVKDLRTQRAVLGEVTAHAAVLDNPQSATRVLREALATSRETSRPVYIEIPKCLFGAEVRVRSDPPRVRRVIDERALRSAVERTVNRLEVAETPCFLVGIDVERFGLGAQVVALAEHFGASMATTFFAQTAVDVFHPQFAGIYFRGVGSREAQKVVEDSDCLVAVGVLNSDLNLAPLSTIDSEHLVDVSSGAVRVCAEEFRGFGVEDFVSGLADVCHSDGPGSTRTGELQRSRSVNESLASAGQTTRYEVTAGFCAVESATGSGLHIKEVIAELNHFFEDHPETPLIADAGDAFFLTVEIHAARKIVPGFYASMGFSVPAALGYEIGSGVRPLVLVGDGAFQMTGLEIANANRLGVGPIVVVLNNQRWQTVATLGKDNRLAQLVDWKYAELARHLGLAAYWATTRTELRQALNEAQASTGPVLIEVIVPPGSVSSTLQGYAAVSPTVSSLGR